MPNALLIFPGEVMSRAVNKRDFDRRKTRREKTKVSLVPWMSISVYNYPHMEGQKENSFC